MTGTAFEELGRRGLPAGLPFPACLPVPLLYFFSFLILLFLFPIPGHGDVGEEVIACSWGPSGRGMARQDRVGGSEIGLGVGASEQRAKGQL